MFIIFVFAKQLEYLRILLSNDIIFFLILSLREKTSEVVVAIVLQIFTLPFIISFHFSQHLLHLFTLKDITQVFEIREMSI